MIAVADVTERLQRLARAAPAAFRVDPVFRYAAVGAIAALLLFPWRLGPRAATVPKPPAPPAPAALGRAYPEDPAPRQAAAPGIGPIAPGRSLDSAVVRPNHAEEADRFGTVAAAQPQPRRPPI